MDQRLISAKFELKSVYQKLDKVLKEVSAQTLEDREVYRDLENLAEKIDSTIQSISYFEKPVIEGKLRQGSNGRYNLVDQDGQERFEFTCGNGIEVYDLEFEEWHVGHVEARGNGEYYFYNNTLRHPALFTGMIARIRE